MNDTTTTGNIELLANGQYNEQWKPEGPAGKWEINAAGELLQTVSVGTRQAGTGTITAKKAAISEPVFEIKLKCRPGSQHQAGIVFNFVDEHNFCVFCIDQHSRESDGYDLLAFAVNKGNLDMISKQSYNETMPSSVIFTLRQIGSNLSLLFNDTLSYAWANMFLHSKRIGLYSYKNADATFLSLSQVAVAAAPPAIQTKQQDVQATNKTEQTIQQPASIVPVNGITDFLGIRQPASKTEIEFTEVFTVPLDSFYSSLLDNISPVSNDKLLSSGVTEIQLLDLRVKRWYRELKLAREELVFAKEDLIRNKARVADAETQLKQGGMDDIKFGDLAKKLLERRAEYKRTLNHINNLRDREGLVLREIRVAGYAVHEATTVTAIKAIGYDFHIVRNGVEPSLYQPVVFEKNPDLSVNEKWKTEEEKLFHQLFDSKAITDKGAAIYHREREQLVNFDACPTLVEVKTQTEEDIRCQEELRATHEDAVKKIEAEIGEWEADKVTLLRQRDIYNQVKDPVEETMGPIAIGWGGAPPDTHWWNYPYAKRLSDAIVGWLDVLATAQASDALYPPHPEFQASLLNKGKGHRVKLKRLIVEVYSEYTKQSFSGGSWGKELWEVGILHGLALCCPEINISFYHRFLIKYDTSYIASVSWGNYQGYQDPIQIYKSNPAYYTISSFGDSEIWTTNQNILDFFSGALQVCDFFIGKAKLILESAKLRLRELEEKVSIHRQRLADLQQNGLSRERQKFLEKWNDPAINMTAPIGTRVHYPDEDPLAEFLVTISGHDGTGSVETYFFAPTPDGFYNQNGLSLQEFMKKQSGQDVICVFPVFDSLGRISSEMVKAVKNPNHSQKIPSLPTIKFVESYRVEVGWLGFGLGELSHSFNLFPGESKELVIEKSTKLSTKISETTSSEETTSTHLTSSFEDNLQNELSVGEKAAQESSSMNKNDTSQSSSTEETSSVSFDISQSISGGVPGIGSAKAEIGFKAGSSSKRNSAFSASQSAEQKRASNQSKDILSKNISNAVHKVASDTSKNNKLAFTAVSSREYEESTTNREVIKLQNPNVGKTVNYNFFQVQNLYGVTTKLIDVQIVIDSGEEMVKGTGINDVRVYDLEEFGKIYTNSEGTDRAAALASIIARQVFKHYGDFLPGVTSGNGSVTVRDGGSVNKELVEILNFSSKESETILKEKIDKIKTALDYLKGIPFQLREKVLSQEATVAVNCAAYHMESQLGFLPATETYLEDRRKIETDKQLALVEQVKAQTKAGVFFQELPGGVTTLTMDGKLNNSVKKDLAKNIE